MLQGCTAWPEESARRNRRQGYWADITLYGMLLRSVAAVPDRIALVQGTRRLRYAELRIAIDRLAGRLIDLGFRPRDPGSGTAGTSTRRNLAHFYPHESYGLRHTRRLARLRLSIAGHRSVRPGAFAAQGAGAR